MSTLVTAPQACGSCCVKTLSLLQSRFAVGCVPGRQVVPLLLRQVITYKFALNSHVESPGLGVMRALSLRCKVFE